MCRVVRSARLAKKVEQGSERAVRACFQDRNRRHDGDEDSGEELRHLEDRLPIEFVLLAAGFRRKRERSGGKPNENEIAQDAYPAYRRPEYLHLAKSVRAAHRDRGNNENE